MGEEEKAALGAPELSDAKTPCQCWETWLAFVFRGLDGEHLYPWTRRHLVKTTPPAPSASTVGNGTQASIDWTLGHVQRA